MIFSDYPSYLKCYRAVGSSLNSKKTIPIQDTLSFDRVTSTINGTLTVDSTARTLTGSLPVTVVDNTNGQTIFSKTFTISMGFGSGSSFRFVLKLPVSPLSKALVCTVTPGAGAVSCFMIRDPDMSGAGSVNIADVTIVFGEFGATMGSPRYNPAADLDATGTVDISDATVMTGTFGAPEFS